METDWTEYAVTVVSKAMAFCQVENNPEALTAATALIYVDWERGHPSYYNTQFAVGTFFLPKEKLRLFAWRMVANGLGGYWQWESHNGGKFSVLGALRHLDILTPEEALCPAQFNEHETHSGCHYFVIKRELLKRLVAYFKLPVVSLDLGGKQNMSQQDWKEFEWFKDRTYHKEGQYNSGF